MVKKFKNKTLAWLDYRLPIFSILREALVDHPTPRNLNYWWNFGSLAGIILGQKLGYNTARIKMEEEIKDKLYNAFKNTKQ